MSYITVDDEQARIISEATGQIEVRDQRGKRLGYIAHHFTPDEVAKAERRSGSTGPWYSTREVLEHLHGLEQA